MGTELRGEEGVPAGRRVLRRVLAEDGIHPEGPDRLIHGRVGEAWVADGVEDGAGTEGQDLRFEPAEDHSGALMPELRDGITPSGVTGAAVGLEGAVKGGAAGGGCRGDGTAEGGDSGAGELDAASGQGVQQPDPGPRPGAYVGRAGGEVLQTVWLGQRALELDDPDGLVGRVSLRAALHPAAS